MKAEKNRVGTKAQIKAEKEGERRIATGVFLALIMVLVGFSVYFAYILANQSVPSVQTAGPASSQPKAAIVDHLSLTFPNQTFIQAATNLLEQAGYAVDYYAGAQVTVDFYRNLPSHGYRLIVLRVHSALGEKGAPPLCLFTGESYSQYKYVSEQLNDQVVRVHYMGGSNEQLYFGITPSFINSCTSGSLQNCTVVLMGCNGLTYTDMANAFVTKGARACIGWDGPVTAGYIDQATACLLKHLVIDKEAIGQAVEDTMGQVGPDPVYYSIMTYCAVGD